MSIDPAVLRKLHKPGVVWSDPGRVERWFFWAPSYELLCGPYLSRQVADITQARLYPKFRGG